jgi:hypothetical protein
MQLPLAFNKWIIFSASGIEDIRTSRNTTSSILTKTPLRKKDPEQFNKQNSKCACFYEAGNES